MDTIITAPAEFASFTDYYQGTLSHFPQEHRTGGSFEINMMQVEQDAVELIDPPIDQFTIVGLMSQTARVEFDAGDGWRPKHQLHKSFFGAQPANQTYGIRMYDPVRIMVAFAPAAIVRTQLERIGIYTDPFLRAYTDFSHKPASMNLFQAMWAAMDAGGPANNLLVDGCYIAILGHMMQEDADLRAFAVVPDLAKPQLIRVIDYIEAHFDVPLLTSELAAIAAMSTAQFGRSFKAATGFSPHHYVTIRRIEHAKRMLRNGTLAITQIAFCCGFSSAAHFATTFQQHMGQPPSAYRTALQ
jgi:AraC family transcriptional regulator